MTKWYIIKVLPAFIWILSQQLHAASGDAVDAINDEDKQVKHTFLHGITKLHFLECARSYAILFYSRSNANVLMKVEMDLCRFQW